MKATPIAHLWQTFSLETRQQIIHLWADLVHNQHNIKLTLPGTTLI